MNKVFALLGMVASAAIASTVASSITSEEYEKKLHNMRFQRDIFFTIGLGLADANDELKAEIEELKKAN